jgi:hypothetical protein
MLFGLPTFSRETKKNISLSNVMIGSVDEKSNCMA